MPGEGLDHIGVKVDSEADKLQEFTARGLEVVSIPETLAVQRLSNGFTRQIGFVKDSDGNWMGLYDHPDRTSRCDPDEYQCILELRSLFPKFHIVFT